MSRKAEFNQNTEQKIIDVATKLFAQNGFVGTSTREICKIAGVNISLISYYFGGKSELYKKIIENIVEGVIAHLTKNFNIDENFDKLDKDKKIEIFLSILDKMIDYFYSDAVSNDTLLLLLREQITSQININAMGYKMIKKLLASILEKSEDDKEVIFRCLTIIGQIHSARVLTQFSLKFLNQEKYTKEDIQMLKEITKNQTHSILMGVNQ
jgi:AcrR family transcriptional regulator